MENRPLTADQRTRTLIMELIMAKILCSVFARQLQNQPSKPPVKALWCVCKCPNKVNLCQQWLTGGASYSEDKEDDSTTIVHRVYGLVPNHWRASHSRGEFNRCNWIQLKSGSILLIFRVPTVLIVLYTYWSQSGYVLSQAENTARTRDRCCYQRGQVSSFF